MLIASWLGTVPAWLTLLTLAVLGYYLTRGQIGPALNYYEQANKALERENAELKARLAAERKDNAVLAARTNLEPMQFAVIAAIEQHERSSAARDEATLNVLGLIADRLGPSDHD